MQGVDHFADLDINVFGTLDGTAQCSSETSATGCGAAVVGASLLGMLVQYKWTAGFESSSPTKRHSSEKYVKQVDTV